MLLLFYVQWIYGDGTRKHVSTSISGARPGKSQQKDNSETWDDALLVPGFPIGYKAEFTYLEYSPGSELLLSVPRW